MLMRKIYQTILLRVITIKFHLCFNFCCLLLINMSFHIGPHDISIMLLIRIAYLIFEWFNRYPYQVFIMKNSTCYSIH